MIPLTAYDTARHPRIDDCVRSIIEWDQYDDWINDPVYYLDVKARSTNLVRGVQSAFNSGTFGGETGITIDLPRGSKPSIKAGYLPLLARVLHYVFVAGAIKTTNIATFRDKVYGFRYIEGTVPLFSSPNAELRELVENLGDLVRAYGDVHIVDARGYLNAITPVRLRQALEQTKVPSADVNIIYALSGVGDADRLASGDDSDAALFDLFLRPVDSELVGRRINFFRYRDDYFSESAEAIDVITDAGRKIGIEFVRKGMVGRDDLVPESSVKFTLEDGTAIAGRLKRLPCVIRDCTPETEAQFLFQEPSLKAFIDQEIRPTEEADAVRLVPCLRHVNKQRAADVLKLPDDPLVSDDLRKLRAEIGGVRGILSSLLNGWRHSPASAWTCCWVVQALSDLGPLTQQEATAISDLAAADSVHGFARCLALVALSRSAPVQAGVSAFHSFAGAPRSSFGSRYFSARALALAHHYLTIRGVRGLALLEGVTADADGLVAFLASARSKRP